MSRKSLRGTHPSWHALLVLAAAGMLARPGAAQAKASQEVLQALGSGFGRISPLGLIICGLAVISILAVLVIWEILRSDSRQREKIDIGWHYFTEMATQKRLTPSETELLKRLVESGGISSADMVFDSSFIYEDSLEAFLKTNAGKLEKDATLHPQLRGLRIKLGFAQLPPEIPLSSTRQVEEGTLATLFDGEDQPRKGRVLEVTEKHWLISLDAEIPPTIASGGGVDVSLLRPGDGEYTTRLTVLGTRLSTHTVFLNHTRMLERKQMRNWVRIDVNIPCRVTVMGKPEAVAGGHPGPSMGMVLEGRLLDLSGGGACARFSSPIPQGHKLSLNFDLPGTSLRGVPSEVMRLSTVVKNGREDYEHNLKFISMETAFQEKIVRYVFEKQRIDSQLRGPIRAE